MIYYVEDEVNIRELALYALKQAGLEAEGFPSAGPFRQALTERVPAPDLARHHVARHRRPRAACRAAS